MRALGADREHLRAATHEQHRLFSDMAGELGAVGQIAGGNARRQIGTARLRLAFSHFVLPGVSSRASAGARGFSQS